jgi:ATP-binding cassette subfamily B protein
MAVVAQQPALFTSNVLENIRYGKQNASEEDVIAAAKAAHIHDFIEQLPNKYYSDLGEKGVRLSGGQKQRITIARAILNNPRVLLLDEATSALDSESEGAIQMALNNLMQGRTTVIIAHRLSTIIHADNIAVMDNGQVVAQGKHAELLVQSKLYSKLAARQFKEL